jgi:hypothetical protein
MTLPGFEPFSVEQVRSFLRPLSWLASPVPAGLEQTGWRALLARVGAARHEDRDVCFALRKEVEREIEIGVGTRMALRDRDPDRHFVQRLLRGLAARVG